MNKAITKPLTRDEVIIKSTLEITEEITLKKDAIAGTLLADAGTGWAVADLAAATGAELFGVLANPTAKGTATITIVIAGVVNELDLSAKPELKNVLLKQGLAAQNYK